MTDVWYSPAESILRGEIVGFLSVEEVARYLIALEEGVARARYATGRLRYFIDCSRSPVQSADVMARSDAAPLLITGPDDRMAIYQQSSLARMQAKRKLIDERTRCFTGQAEARAWVMA